MKITGEISLLFPPSVREQKWINHSKKGMKPQPLTSLGNAIKSKRTGNTGLVNQSGNNINGTYPRLLRQTAKTTIKSSNKAAGIPKTYGSMLCDFPAKKERFKRCIR